MKDAMRTATKFLDRHPLCCFCGGDRPAATIDHQPARIVFPDKRRPKGLEFPACENCNRQTSPDEALLAFVCRFTGSQRSTAVHDFHRLRNIVSSVNRAFPGLFERMKGRRIWAYERGILVRKGAIDVNQPEVHLSLCRIGAKLALAIYYQLRSLPAVSGCQINTQWTHSQNEDNFNHIQNLIQLAPGQASLQMGKWNTDESFFLRYHYENGQLFCVAIFHQSVALIAKLCEPSVPLQEKWQFSMSPRLGTGITVLP
jgi:hypothetical protein